MMSRRRRAIHGPAFSMVEVILSMITIGVMLTSVMKLVAQSRKVELVSDDRARASQLASMLMAEVVSKAFVEPGSALAAPPALGPDAGETVGRGAWDDVDDYEGLSESPPTNPDSTKVAGTEGWTWSVRVRYVNESTPNLASASPTMAKQIEVSIQKGATPLAELVTIRTSAGTR